MRKTGAKNARDEKEKKNKIVIRKKHRNKRKIKQATTKTANNNQNICIVCILSAHINVQHDIKRLLSIYCTHTLTFFFSIFLVCLP